jgi:hypothetical protein
MIYECPSGHIRFSKDDLTICAMKGCIKQTVVISPIDIDWFYKINKDGLCIDKRDFHMIIDDPNMPKNVKKQIQKIFHHLASDRF